ncbi:hypothetical protein [Vacuolonema iberomarrocanum]|uniref:hypothetical protein n=1 Tax=Vacuolonema iberomarrocanum TaxID=3454632 RepID=UPI003F6DAA54
MKVAFGCHLVAALLLLVFGLVYLFRPEFMPYHAVALDREWSAVERPYQVLILALMRATGGAWLAIAVAMIVLLFIPFRRGYKWVYWTIPAVGLLVSGPAFYATTYVRQNTPANPPWIAVVIGVLLSAVGLVLSLRADSNKLSARDRSKL